jgi:CRISPR-associated protein Csh2
MRERIERVYIWQDADLRTVVDGEEVSMAAWMGDLLGPGRIETIEGI